VPISNYEEILQNSDDGIGMNVLTGIYQQPNLQNPVGVG